MNCKCIQLVQEQIIKTQPLKDKKILEVRLPTSLNIVAGKLKTALTIEATCSIFNRKTPYKLLLNYSFCPFCGKASVGDYEELLSQDELIGELVGIPEQDIKATALVSWLKAKGLKIYREVKDGKGN